MKVEWSVYLGNRPYSRARCRLISVNGAPFNSDSDEKPAAGFVEGDRLVRDIALDETTSGRRVIRLELEAVKHLCARSGGRQATFQVEMFYLDEDDVVVADTREVLTRTIDNPFPADAATASHAAAPTSGTPEIADTQASRPEVEPQVAEPNAAKPNAAKPDEPEPVADEPPGVGPEATAEPWRMNVWPAGAAKPDKEDTSPIEISVDVLKGWEGDYLELVTLEAHGPADASALLLAKIEATPKRQVDLVLKRKSVEFEMAETSSGPWDAQSWRVRADKTDDYVLCLTSTHAPDFNPAALFEPYAVTEQVLEGTPFKITLQLGDHIRLLKVASKPATPALQTSFLMRTLAIQRPRWRIVRLPDGPFVDDDVVYLDGARPIPTQAFVLGVATQTQVVFEPLFRSKTATAAFADAGFEIIDAVDENEPSIAKIEPAGDADRPKRHATVELRGTADPDRPGMMISRAVLKLEIRADTTKESGFRTYSIPLEFHTVPPFPLLVLAIDIGSSTIAAAMASSASNRTVLLPLAEALRTIPSAGDPRRPDAGDPYLIPSSIEVTMEGDDRDTPWIATIDRDPLLRDGDEEAMRDPALRLGTANKRIPAHAPKRKYEVIAPARPDAPKASIVEDPKMELRSKESTAFPDGRRPLSLDQPQETSTVDLVRLQIERLLLHFVPAAVARLTPEDLRALGVADPRFWDALYVNRKPRSFMLVLSHPASCEKAAVNRYFKAVRDAYRQRFESAAFVPVQVNARRVPEALAVAAALRARGPRGLGEGATAIVDMGAATTDVAVVAPKYADGLAVPDARHITPVSFAIPVAGRAIRGWIAADLRAAAKTTSLPDADALDREIDRALRARGQKDFIVVPLSGSDDLTIEAARAHFSGFAQPVIQIVRFAEALWALAPIGEASQAPALRQGLTTLLEMVAAGLAHSVVDHAIHRVVLSGRGAALPLVKALLPAAVRRVVGRKGLKEPPMAVDVTSAGEVLAPGGSHEAQLRAMKAAVAEGAARRALDIDMRAEGEVFDAPGRRYALVVCKAGAGPEGPSFAWFKKGSVLGLFPLRPPAKDGLNEDAGVIKLKTDEEVWLARYIPGFELEDLASLDGRRAAGREGGSTTDEIAYGVARQCLVPHPVDRKNGAWGPLARAQFDGGFTWTRVGRKLTMANREADLPDDGSFD